MKPTNRKTTPLVLALLTAGLTIGLVSWDYKQAPGQYQQSKNDTTPKKKTDREKKVRDLDDVLDELDKADFDINMEKVQKEIEKAMKEIDMAKIQREVQESLAKVDFKKIQEEMKEAMKDFDAAKIQKEVQESLAKVDWEKMKLEIEKVKDIDMKKMTEEMKKVQEEMKELGPKMQKEMEKAKVEIEKAKAEMKEYKGFVDGLNDDGLINKKEAYTLKHKDGELFINGKKATEQTYNKYRTFLEKHKKFDIEKSDDDFDID
jgi:hypothetical protein